MPKAGKKFKGLKGEYLLLAPLGQGSSSEMQLAVQVGAEGPGRFLVFKQLKSSLAGNEGQTKRFLREARISAILQHPSLPRTVETGKIADTYFVMQEFLLGDSLGYMLSQAIESGQVITPRLAACLAVQACDALAYLHGLQSSKGEELNLLHRNVSLKTLVLQSDGRLKLTNINLRRRDDLPHPSSSLGHQSPELSAGMPSGPASDIFSLGVVLWETLTGQNLFLRESKLDTRMALTECRVPSPRELRSKVPEELEQVVLKALKKEPGERFASAEEMARKLRSFLGDPNDIAIIEEARQFTERVDQDRLRTKAAMLEDLEAGREEKADTKLLLPCLDYSLPQAGKPKASEEKAPEPAPLETQPKDKEPTEPEVFETEDTAPQLGRPAGRTPKQYVQKWLQLLRDRDWRAIAGTAGAAVVLLLIIILAWPSGDEVPEESKPTEPVEEAAVAPPTEPVKVRVEAPKETPPVKAPDRPALARLQIITDPAGCAVKLDDLELSGATPLENVIVPAGMDHQVVVSCKGFKVESRTVTPQAGELVPLEFYPPEAGSQGKSYGRLQLFTKPKTTVYLGKRKLGTTPIKGLKLPAGTHRIRLFNKRARINKKLEVAIEPGKTTKLRPKL